MANTFNDFLNVIRKDPNVRIKMNDMLDRYNKLPYNYQSKKGCDSLIQNVHLQELLNIMGTTITDLDIQLKMKISRIEYLESKTNSQILKRVWQPIVMDVFDYVKFFSISDDNLCHGK